MSKATTDQRARRPVGWRLPAEIRKALKVAAVQDDTTMEAIAERVIVQDLRRRGLLPADSPRPPAA